MIDKFEQAYGNRKYMTWPTLRYFIYKLPTACATWTYDPGEFVFNDGIAHMVKPYGIICSNCGTFFKEKKSKMYEFKYCPHCGYSIGVE
jgi:hypothetical protein